MSPVPQLCSFYAKAPDDDRLSTSHISLYMALFQLWNLNHFINPVKVSRRQLMRMSKIASFTTFHKCIKELQRYRYIEYQPTYNYYRGSYVYVL